MSAKRQLLMLDTNVWLDCYDRSRPGCGDAAALVDYALQEGIGLLITPMSLKDFYYHIARAVKNAARREGADVTPQVAQAAEEFAWECVQHLLNIATVASAGTVDAAMSRSLHRVHRDFEDDLLLAVAMRCEVAYLVTSDKRLASNAPLPTLNARQTLSLLRGVQ